MHAFTVVAASITENWPAPPANEGNTTTSISFKTHTSPTDIPDLLLSPSKPANTHDEVRTRQVACVHAAQPVDCDVAPVVFPYVPAGHALQASAPADDANKPTPQGAHVNALAAPVALLYVPFGHSWQLVFKYVPLPGETSPNKPAGPASVVINNRGEQH